MKIPNNTPNPIKNIFLVLIRCQNNKGLRDLCGFVQNQIIWFAFCDVEYVILSIIIPIYNEEGNIPILQSRLSSALDKVDMQVEYVYINDGSVDSSLVLLQQMASDNEQVKYINLSRNFGHQLAVTAGLEKCKGDAAVIIDADLQDPPELIPQLIEKWKAGNEVVYAKRKTRKGESRFKLLTAGLFYRLLSKITSIDIPVDTGDFRLIDRKIIDLLAQMKEKNKYLRGQISWLGFSQTFVEYDRDERYDGETGYSLKKMISFALDGITSFSDFPLKIVTLFGFLCSALSFLIIIYSLYSKYMWDDTVPGWASLMVSVLFLGGVQMIALGIIGEYISRIISNVRNRPTYVIKDSNIDR